MIATGTLIVHIIAGFVALAVGPVAMVSRKGGALHRRTGLVYVWAMVVVVFTAIFLAIYDPNVLLLVIAVLSFYLTFTGYRALSHKQLHLGKGVTPLDWGVSVVTLLFGLGLIVYGVTLSGEEAFLALFFGVLTCGLVLNRCRRYLGKAQKGDWFFNHIIGMLSAYIATFTAFAVTNVTFLPEAVVFVVPTVLGSAAISLTITHYKKKVAQGKPLRELVVVRGEDGSR